jgi:hypothetical protein
LAEFRVPGIAVKEKYMRTALPFVVVGLVLGGHRGFAQAGDHDGHGLTAADGVAIAKLLDEHKKLTLAKAVAHGENVSGGKVFSAVCAYEDDPFGEGNYVHVTMYAIEGGELWDIHLDQKASLRESGASKPKPDDKAAQERFSTGTAVLAAMDTAKLTLSKAIEAAEKHTNGRALVAAAVMADKTPIVCVHALTGDKIVCCHVAMDGKVTDAPAKSADQPGAAPAKP